MTFSAKDKVGNVESPAHKEIVLAGANIGCAIPAPTFTIPAHGSVTITGTATVGGRTVPFTRTVTY